MAVNCYKYYITSPTGGLWSGVDCSGNSVGGFLLPNAPIFTDCIQEETLYLREGLVISYELCGVINDTPTPTPTITSTPINSPTNTPTPTITPTISITPSNTPTISVTPSSTNLSCASGITDGQFYYTDCCGNFIEGYSGKDIVIYNPSLPNYGVILLGGYFDYICVTPTVTPTNTQTPTPTTSQTPETSPTSSPTPTPTPTITCSLSPIIEFYNPCKPFTLFDMGIECNVIQSPTSPTSFDGILSIIVTGGTPPYSFYWSSGDRTQTLYDIPAGSYEVLVVDFYGDYSATTICNLLGPTSTPTPTVTQTQTPTPTFVTPTLCLYVNAVISGTPIYSQFIFEPNGEVNGRNSWYSTEAVLNLIWNSTLLRWEIPNWSFGGLPISTTQDSIPLSNWTLAGNNNQQAILVMSEGTCSETLPLNVSVVVNNTSCQGVTNCNGSIVVNVVGGHPPYSFSLNGTTSQTSNIFNNLCAGTFSLTVNDSSGNTYNQNIVINSNTNPITYTTSIAIDRIESANTNLKTVYWSLAVNPPLTQGGPQVSLNLYYNIVQNILGPFFNNDPAQTATITAINLLTKNGVDIPVNTPVYNTTLTDRPNCSPLQQQNKYLQGWVPVTIGYGDIISGASTSNVVVNNAVISTNSCVTTAQQTLLINTQNPTVLDCVCCSVVSDNTPRGISNHTVVGTIIPVVCTEYRITPAASGPGVVSLRFTSCNGQTINQTYFAPTNFCAITGTPVIIAGTGTITNLGQCLT